MSKKAEQAAMKAYPEDWEAGYFDDPDEVTDDNEEAREYFREGYEQAEKDTIERACKWLFSHFPILIDYYDEDIYKKADRSEFIKLFRTQMEEQ